MVKTRIAPSPTGPLHIGTARTALFNWLFARQNNGKFLLRLEDTDKERSEKRFEDNITSGLEWLDINWDEFLKQSDRLETYRNYAEGLFKKGLAHKEKGEKGSEEAIILNNQQKDVSFEDIIRGQIKFKSEEVGNVVLIKSDGTATYNFAVAIDDAEAEITHVIRGEDHIPNTPKQIAVQEALGFKKPKYAHLPLILAPDRSKLSKRHGATSVEEYKNMGYLPEALCNFMALLGWNPGGEKEIFSREELVKEFSLERIHKGGAAFNIEKLNWINQQYIQDKSVAELKKNLEEYDNVFKETPDAFVNMVKTRIKTLAEARDDLTWLEKPDYDLALLTWKNAPREKTKESLETSLKFIKELSEEEFTAEILEEKLMPLAQKRENRGEMLWPLRVALSGKQKSPSPFELAALFGKKETIKRIEAAIEKIS